MSIVTGTGSATPGVGPSPERARLTEAMRQLEGVFVQELFKAMRATVPDEGVASGGSAGQMFTSMLDEKLASLVPESWRHEGLESALLRQFRGHLPAGADGARDTGSSVPTSVIPQEPDA